MNGYELLRILYGLFIGLFLIIAGALTFTSKDEPGIGFRIGYTYLSERARRKANRVSGIGTILTGIALILLSLFLPMSWLFIVMTFGLGGTFLLAYLTAKREYELEELSTEAPEETGRRIEPPKMGNYIALQAFLTGVSSALVLTGKIPRDSGIILIVSLQLFLLALTVLFSRPLVFQLAPKFKGKMALGFARAMTIVSTIVTLQLSLVALKPNASPLLAVLLLFVSLGAIFYAVFTVLTSAYEEGYY